MLDVVQFQRRQRKSGNFSVEIYFERIREELAGRMKVRLAVCRYESTGLFKRLYNVVEAALRQGTVNHITGDVHFLALLMRRRRTILTVLDCGMLKGLSGMKLRVLKWAWFTMPAARSKYITVISDATKEDLLRYIDFPQSRIRTIYVAVSPTFSRNEKTFDAENPALLQIGTAENKNLRRLIPALNGIRCRLWIVGVVSEEMKALLQEHHVAWENFLNLSQEEMVRLYERSDLLTFVSTLEGFGMPIVEANIVGRAVLTGNVSSMPEIGGDAAHYADPNDVASIREGVLKLINEEEYRNRLIENGYRNAERFGAAAIARQYEDLYETVAARV